MKNITKVKCMSRKLVNESKENSPGWKGVLADIRADIDRLEELAFVVERKIARGESWPGNKSAASQPALQDGRGV